MQIWRISARDRTLTRQPVPEAWARLGGRGLLARILLDEVPAESTPLGPRNKLVFAPGLLAGFGLSSCDRISIGGKSPLTGGIKESNAGGRTALHLRLLGIKALVIEDQPVESGWWVLHVSTEGIRLDRADDLAGLGVYEAASRLLKQYGEDIALALIGPGGEMRLASAGIQNLDKDRTPSRMAARGGLGAVMGSKGLKAIVIDASGGEKSVIRDPERFREAQRAFLDALMNHPQTRTYTDYGTAAMTLMCDALGGLPTRGFSGGRFEGAENISGEHLREILLRRGGEAATTHACMAGCVIRCSNCFVDVNGKAMVSPLEYETIALMGSNLGFDDLDTIARLNWEANDIGIDSIEIGAALGVAAEAGLWAFGDSEGAATLLDEIRRGTPLGRVLGSGAAVVGRVFGVERVPAVKGQAMSGYEPRSIKGTGVTYATSPQGADHTCGLTIRAKVNHLDPAGQVELSRTAQFNMAGYDTLGVCIFAGFGFAAAPANTIGALLKACYDWDAPDDILKQLGRETIALEREFNRRAGFTAAHDRIPEWMRRERLPPHDTVFDVPNEELDKLFD